MSPRISLVHQFAQHKDETWHLRFSLDGRMLVSSDGEALHLWRLHDDGCWVYERSLPFRGAAFPCFAPNGQFLAFGGKEEFIRLISLDGKKIATLSCPSHADWAFSPDQHWLVSSDTVRDILLWDLTTYQSSPIAIPFSASGQDDDEAELSKESVGCFRFTPDGARLLFGAHSPEGYVHIADFDPIQKRILWPRTLRLSGIVASAISPNGKLLAIINVDLKVSAYKTDVYIYDLELLRLPQKFSSTTNVRYCLLAFSPDSQLLAGSKDDGTVDIWSMSSFVCVASFAAHPGLTSQWSDPIGGLDWSSTGYIATGGASVFENNMNKTDYTIKIWQVAD